MSAVRDNTSLRNIVAITMRDAGGTARTSAEALMRGADGALRAVFESLTASVSPASVDGYGDSSAAISITTAAATATPAGGVAPYSSAWSYVSGDTATINAPTSASTSFTFASIGPGDSKSGIFKCTVTDANGVTADTGSLIATATNVSTA